MVFRLRRGRLQASAPETDYHIEPFTHCKFFSDQVYAKIRSAGRISLTKRDDLPGSQKSGTMKALEPSKE